MKKSVLGLCMMFHGALPDTLYAIDDQSDDQVIDEKNRSAWLLQEEGESVLDEPDLPKEVKPEMEFKGMVMFNPSFNFQDGMDLNWSQGLKAKLEGVHKQMLALCGKHLQTNISLNLTPNEVKLGKACAQLGPCTIGYGPTFLGYSKQLLLPGAVVASRISAKVEHRFGLFRFGYALEQPLEPTWKKFDPAAPKKEEVSDASSDKKKDDSFKLGGYGIALALQAGLVHEQFDASLSGLARLSSYKATPKDQKSVDMQRLITWGTQLGMQYQVIPDRLKWSNQFFFTSGLGDYIMGFKELQKEEDGNAPIYYTDTSGNELSAMRAWGGGGSVDWHVTPQWIFTVSGNAMVIGSGLDDVRPKSAASMLFLLGGGVNYKLNDYITIGSGYSLSWKQTLKEDEAIQRNYTIPFSCKVTF